MNRTKKIFTMLSFLIALTILGGLVANAIDIGQLLKVLGVGAVVDRFAGPLNDGINKLTLSKKVAGKEATKVVSIISVGTGGDVGAAQVSGPKDKVAQVKAVAQLELSLQRGIFRAKVLIPVTTKEVLKGLTRVYGVGVSAVIDIKI